MKQYFAFLFLFCIPYQGSCQINAIYDSLIPFYLTYSSGGVVPTNREINIYKTNNKYFASYFRPKFYFRGETDSAWTTELDSNKIFSCLKFINMAKKQPKECEYVNEYTHYEIDFAKDTLEISGDCEWNDLNYYSLSYVLFKEHFLELEQRKINLIDSISKKLIGSWYCVPFKTALKEGDSCVLSRTKYTESDCLFMFGDNELFKSNCNGAYDFTLSHKFKLDVEDQLPRLLIGKEDMKEGDYEGEYIVSGINEKELKLTFEWQK